MRLTNMPFPFRQDVSTGHFFVHISTIERMMKIGWIKGATKEAKQAIRLYAEEAALTFRANIEMQDSDQKSEWLKHLNPKHYNPLPFQIVGMQRLYSRFVNFGNGIILGDDVGLGKTIQAIGIIGRLRAEGKLRRVIVTTTSGMKSQWSDEIAKFSRPKLRTATADGSREKRIERLASDADVYIVNHEMFRFDHYAKAIDRIIDNGVDLIVIDESSYVKNYETVTHKAIFDRVQRIKWALPLNATVIENSLEDFFAQVRLCDRHLLGNHAGFDARYIVRGYAGQIVKYKNLKEFRKRTAITMYRRTRSQVRLQLPQVIVQARQVSMGTEQASEYRTIVEAAVSERGSGAIKMAKLAKVQRAAYASASGQSAKIDDLIGLLNSELKGERIVVFTRFKEIAKDAFDRLKEYAPALITGDTGHAARNDTRRRFASRHGAGSILIGTEAMDRGLNLQAAGVIVNLDLPWNPAKLRQRIGRINRVGQERESVLVINYIATHPKGPTIDDYMISKILPKRDLFRAVLSDDDTDEIGTDTTNPDAVMEYISGVL